MVDPEVRIFFLNFPVSSKIFEYFSLPLFSKGQKGSGGYLHKHTYTTLN